LEESTPRQFEGDCPDFQVEFELLVAVWLIEAVGEGIGDEELYGLDHSLG
jgi:hypothetical protein